MFSDRDDDEDDGFYDVRRPVPLCECGAELDFWGLCTEGCDDDKHFLPAPSVPDAP